MSGWVRSAADHIRSGRDVALVTVLSAEGSTPREVGARMLVSPDRRPTGTIGGGALEYRAEDQARRLLARHDRAWAIQDYPLGPFLKQCCGGFVRLLLERLDETSLPWLDEAAHATRPYTLTAIFHAARLERGLRYAQWPGQIIHLVDADGRSLPGRRPRPAEGDRLMEGIDPRKPRLVIFGAGHVGQAVARQFAHLPFVVEQYDPRPEAAGPGVATYSEDELVEMAGLLGDDDFACILTHSHDLDYRLTHAILDAATARYCGLIGSRSKKARFLARLAEDGLEESAIARLTCPIGIPELKGKAPEVIAVAIAAQLLQMVQDEPEDG